MKQVFKKVNMKIEYDDIPIRHLAIQCPYCKSWFIGHDIIKGDCSYKHQLSEAECECPKCSMEFKIDYRSDMDESGDFPGFYDNCLRQKVTWE